MLLACVSMLAAFATIMLGVVAREAGWDIQGLDAYAGYSIAAALSLALPGTLQNGDHIRVSLTRSARPLAYRTSSRWALLAGLTLALFMAWYARGWPGCHGQPMTYPRRQTRHHCGSRS